MLAATRPHDDDQRRRITVCAMLRLPPLITLFPQHGHEWQVGSARSRLLTG